MAHPDIRDGWYATSKELARALLRAQIPAVAREIVDAVKLATYGAIPRRKAAPITVSALSRSTKRDLRNVRRNLDALIAAKIIVEMTVPDGTSLGRGERYLGIQKNYDLWVWRSPRAGESHARKPREVQLDLLARPTSEGAPAHIKRAPRPASEGATAHIERRKSEPVSTCATGRTEEVSVRRTDVVPDVPARAMAPVRNDSGSRREPSTTTTEPRGGGDAQPLLAGLFENEILRRGAEARLRSAVKHDLLRDAEAYLRAEIARVKPRKPGAFVNGLLKDRMRLIAASLERESRRCEAIAMAQGPPEDDGPRGGGAPRAGAAPASGGPVFAPKGVDGRPLAKRADASRVDPFALLAALGIEIGRAA